MPCYRQHRRKSIRLRNSLYLREFIQAVRRKKMRQKWSLSVLRRSRRQLVIITAFCMCTLFVACHRVGASAPVPPSAANPTFSCAPGEEWCLGTCRSTVDFLNDSNNCGRCGNSCSAMETCSAGSCTCAAGYSMCMGNCMNDSSFIGDNSNCGRCGNICSIGESCVGGTCMKMP